MRVLDLLISPNLEITAGCAATAIALAKQGRKSAMNPQRYALIVAIVFAAIAVLQLTRAVLGWPHRRDQPVGNSDDPGVASLCDRPIFQFSGASGPECYSA
jgi:hypothetical protein